MTKPITSVDGIELAGDQLRQFIERIERLEEEKSGLAADVRDLYAQAKSTGFDPKIIRQIIRIRAMEQHQVDEEESLLHLYRQALGML